ncbi:MAG: hypothetical protein LBR94_00910 [Desulfovibrio sp.]|jgi:hypothetical protein|nr:hypothetical protein [Desulfovibrio sp.]
MKITFLEECVVKNADGTIKRQYQKGKAYDVGESTARHWIFRRKAVVVNEKIPSPPEPSAPPSDLSDKTEKRHNDKRLKAVTVTADDGKNSPNAAFAKGEDM